MCLLIVTFHEIAIKYESELKTQLVLLDISTNHNVGLPKYLHLKFCQMMLCIQDAYHVMKDFYLCGQLLSFYAHINLFFTPEMKYMVRGNIRSGKFPFGEMSFTELFIGEMYFRGIDRLGNCSLGNYPSGKCLQGTDRRILNK